MTQVTWNNGREIHIGTVDAYLSTGGDVLAVVVEGENLHLVSVYKLKVVEKETKDGAT